MVSFIILSKSTIYFLQLFFQHAHPDCKRRRAFSFEGDLLSVHSIIKLLIDNYSQIMTNYDLFVNSDKHYRF